MRSNLGIIVFVLEVRSDKANRFNRFLAFRRQLERSGGRRPGLVIWNLAGATKRWRWRVRWYGRLVRAGGRQGHAGTHDVGARTSPQFLIVRLLRPAIVVATET